MGNPQWLGWAQRLQAIAQTGLTYAKDPFDIERYENIRELAAEIMASGTSKRDIEPIVDLFKGHLGYATPKIEVRAAAISEGKILLVKEKEDGCWTMPGGWADVGDPPSVAVINEVKQESGYDVTVKKLAALYDRNLHGHPPYPFHSYKAFFLCDLIGGSAIGPNNETLEVGFFAEDEIPPLSLIRVTPKQISHLFDHSRHPEWPTSFD
jgi:ADP-ribose pyrophosphatase YjhB (NUDIX family)